jgi:hypothetical protein
MEAEFDLANAKELVAWPEPIAPRYLCRGIRPAIVCSPEVTDSRADERLLLAVQALDALEAFNHPPRPARIANRKEVGAMSLGRLARFVPMAVAAVFAAAAAAGRWG